VTQRQAPTRSNTEATETAPVAGAGSPASGAADAARDGVISAFVLGWHVAELFHANVPRSVQRRQASSAKLAGIGDLDPLSRARLLLVQVQADLQRAWRFGDSGQRPPDPSPIQLLLEADGRPSGQPQAAVGELHRQLLVGLTAADFRLGKAYGLGRALAETALLPDAKNPETFQRAFARFRLANLLDWLADLKSAFPPHAAEAVRGSLQAWAAWSHAPTLRPAIEDQPRASDAEVDGQASGTAPTRPHAAVPRWVRRVTSKSGLARQPLEPQARPVDWQSAPDREGVTRALHRQGQLWRAVLSGEKDCLDLLSTDDYLWAADQLLSHIRRLTLRFLRRFWITTTAVAVIISVAVVTVLVVRAVPTVVAAVLTAAGAVGLTWRGAASGLGRVLAQAQRPLWDSELDVAVANAVTRLPRQRRTSDRSAAPDGPPEEPNTTGVDAGDAEEHRRE
jgi:hypothetical protein